jgi:hypothetical protein
MAPKARSSWSLRSCDISSGALDGTGGEELADFQACAMPLDASRILIANSRERLELETRTVRRRRSRSWPPRSVWATVVALYL